MNTLLLCMLIAAPLAAGLLAWLAAANPIARRLCIGGSALGIAAAGLLAVKYGTPVTRLGDAAGSLLLLGEAGMIAAVIWLGWRLRNWIVTIMGLAQAGLLAAELISHGTDLPPAVFHLDPLASILVLIITLVGPCILVYALGYMQLHRAHAPATAGSDGRFFFFLIAFLGLMNGLVLADDFHALAFFWEATTLCSFFLIGHDGTPPAKRSAEQALFLNSIGGAALSLAGFMASAAGRPTLSSLNDGAFLLPVALLALAAFIKSAQLPFQSWLLGAMVAPSPVSALLHSSTMVKAGSYLILRLTPGFGDTPLALLVALIGAFTFAVASGIAVGQSDGKRVLAYSTIANLGLIAACAGVGNPLAYSAALVLIIFHAVSKALLFLCIGAIEQKIGSRQIEQMSGLMFKMPLTTMIMVGGMISMVVPPFGMLIGKWIAIESASQFPLILLLFILGSALTVLFWSKWIGRIITTSYHESYTVETLPFAMRAAMLLLLTGVIWCGFSAMPIYRVWLEPLALSAVPLEQSAIAPLLAAIRGFRDGPLFVLLLAVTIASLLSLRTVRKAHLKRPFLCGENVGEGDTKAGYEFFSAMDKPVQAQVPSYYLNEIVGEARVTKYANPIALLILLSLFARLMLV